MESKIANRRYRSVCILTCQQCGSINHYICLLLSGMHTIFTTPFAIFW